MRFDVIIVGHTTIDINVLPWGIIENVLGGAPTYAGFTLTSLGRDVGVISKIGRDFPEMFPPLFSKFGLDTEGILATPGKTTKFENRYDEEERKQFCESVADPLSAEDIPGIYRDARSFYFSPVAGEISPKMISSVKGDNTTLMLDPQGIFREIGENGEVSVQLPDNLNEYLENMDIVKIGQDELTAFEEDENTALRNLVELGPKVAILTLGERGCLVLTENKFNRIRGMDVEVKDLTGAGDVFGAAFLSHYLDTGNVIKSSSFATVASGLKLRYKGPVGFPNREEIEERLVN